MIEKCSCGAAIDFPTGGYLSSTVMDVLASWRAVHRHDSVTAAQEADGESEGPRIYDVSGAHVERADEAPDYHRPRVGFSPDEG